MDPNTISQLTWCKNVTNAINFVKPSDNVARAHLERARSSIRSMDANWREQGLDDWVITTSYYAKYFAVSALLDRVGLKCENHSCVATLFDYLFSGIVPEARLQDFTKSKEDRIEAQYYSSTTNMQVGSSMQQTKVFVLEMEQLFQSIRPNSKRAMELAKRVQGLKSL